MRHIKEVFTHCIPLGPSKHLLQANCKVHPANCGTAVLYCSCCCCLSSYKIVLLLDKLSSLPSTCRKCASLTCYPAVQSRSAGGQQLELAARRCCCSGISHLSGGAFRSLFELKEFPSLRAEILNQLLSWPGQLTTILLTCTQLMSFFKDGFISPKYCTVSLCPKLLHQYHTRWVAVQ
jgi:hypothetical protein